MDSPIPEGERCRCLECRACERPTGSSAWDHAYDFARLVLDQILGAGPPCNAKQAIGHHIVLPGQDPEEIAHVQGYRLGAVMAMQRFVNTLRESLVPDGKVDDELERLLATEDCWEAYGLGLAMGAKFAARVLDFHEKGPAVPQVLRELHRQAAKELSRKANVAERHDLIRQLLDNPTPEQCAMKHVADRDNSIAKSASDILKRRHPGKPISVSPHTVRRVRTSGRNGHD